MEPRAIVAPAEKGHAPAPQRRPLARGASTYRPSLRGVRVPLGRLRLGFADGAHEAEFVEADVGPLVLSRLPWVCALVAVFDAIHLGARVLEWPHAGGAPMDARLACACLLPAIVAWSLLALVALLEFERVRRAKRASATLDNFEPIVLPAYRALGLALGGALVLDALPLDILADPALLLARAGGGGDALQPGLAALALQHLLAPLLVTSFCPVDPLGLFAAGATAVWTHALAGARAGLPSSVVAQCTLAQTALLAFVVAHRWDAGAIERKRFYRARHAWLAHSRTLVAKQNGEQMHAVLREAEKQKALSDANQSAAAARAQLIRVLSHDVRGPLLIATNVAGEMSDACDEAADNAAAAADNAAPTAAAAALRAPGAPPPPAPVDAETFQRMSEELQASTAAISRILAELCEFGQGEAKQISLAVGAFALRDLYGAFRLSSAALAAEAAGVRFVCEPLAPEAGELCVTADLARLAQVVEAGVSNAVNASAAGGAVRVSMHLAPPIDQQLLELEAAASKAGWVLVVVRVTDQGSGLGAKELGALQQGAVFALVGKGQLNGTAATGVGLAHARRLLELHDGSTLALESEGRGRGCAFELRLKLRRAHPSDPPAPRYEPVLREWPKRTSSRGRASNESAASEEVASLPEAAAGAREAPRPQRPLAIVPPSATVPTGAPRRLRPAALGPSTADAAAVDPEGQDDSFLSISRRESERRGFSRLALMGVRSVLGRLASISASTLEPADDDARPLASKTAADSVGNSPSASIAGPPRVAPQPSAPKPPKPTFREGFRALYAEDDPVLRKSVVLRVFKPLGVTVDEACDGAEALRRCDALEAERATLGLPSKDGYAFVLLDNQMPHMTGTQVVEELRVRGYSTQIVGMTGDPRGCTDRAIFEVSGVDCCLDKDAASVRKVREMLAAHALPTQLTVEPQQADADTAPS
jgi:signal transduction histidine kinase/CheY-like chemotaxis protein